MKNAEVLTSRSNMVTGALYEAKEVCGKMILQFIVNKVILNDVSVINIAVNEFHVIY